MQFNGKIAFQFQRDEALKKVREYWPQTGALIGFKCVFNVSVTDDLLNLTAKGYTTTHVLRPGIKLVWIGDTVRTFKPDSVMRVNVSVMFSLLLSVFTTDHTAQ